MSGRVPIAEDASAIAARLAELRAERARIIAGCHCPRDALGTATHAQFCPLRPAAPSQMEMALEAMQRARARLRQAGVPIRERAALIQSTESPGLVAGVAVTSTPTLVGPGAAKGCWPDTAGFDQPGPTGDTKC